jgi:hypothetical protein
MTDLSRPHKKSVDRTARDERLARALRENLRRRKEQARAKQDEAVRQSKQRRGGGERP